MTPAAFVHQCQDLVCSKGVVDPVKFKVRGATVETNAMGRVANGNARSVFANESSSFLLHTQRAPRIPTGWCGANPGPRCTGVNITASAKGVRLADDEDAD